HLTKGMAVLAAYTWSKSIFTGAYSAIDDASSQDVYNRRLERAIAPFSIPHIFKLTWVYDLPFGKGRRWQLGSVLGHVVGGWTLTGIHNYRAGNPLSISTSGIRSPVLFNGTIRPD